MSKIKRTPGHAPMAFCLLLAISRPVLIMSQSTLPITASPVPTVSPVPVSAFEFVVIWLLYDSVCSLCSHLFYIRSYVFCFVFMSPSPTICSRPLIPQSPRRQLYPQLLQLFLHLHPQANQSTPIRPHQRHLLQKSRLMRL